MRPVNKRFAEMRTTIVRSPIGSRIETIRDSKCPTKALTDNRVWLADVLLITATSGLQGA